MTTITPPRVVLDIARATAAAGGRAWLVGGVVRDHLMGLPVKDWDLEVYGLPADDLEAVLRRIGRVDTVGKSFSVFKLRKRGDEIDVSIPRRDSKQGPGHKGIQAVGDHTMSPEEAVTRRDLTINAIMLDPLTGERLDPSGGADDLAASRLCPVDETTFLEDPLRALRAVQFAARFGFEPSETLVDLCRRAQLHELPPERVLVEWEKLLLRGRHIAHGLALARRSGVLERVFPEAAEHTQESHDRLLDDALPHRDQLDAPARRFALMLAVWLHNLPEKARVATLDRIRVHRWLGVPVRDVCLALAAHYDDDHTTAAALRWMSTRTEVDLALRVRAVVRGEDTTEQRAHAAALGVAHEQPKRLLEGRDLIELGVPKGPMMGTIVKEVYAAQLDGSVTDHASAVEHAKGLLDG